MDFGASGSGVVRQWKQYDTVLQKQTDIQNQQTSRPVYQYSFAGPLTMSKGCDLAIELKRDNTPLRDYIYRGSNPAVVTDATCYMDWIAEQYQLRLENDYDSKTSCSQGSGDKEDINKEECWTSDLTRCDWNHIDNDGRPFDYCRLSAEQYQQYVFQCVDTEVSTVTSQAQSELTLL